MSNPDKTRQIRLTVVSLVAVIAVMGGLVSASVPLYRLFCQVTGFGGTTQVADKSAVQVLDRVVRVRFSGDVARGLQWRFKPEQEHIDVKVGEESLGHYRATNQSDRRIVGTATYNVTPLKAGIYFSKIDCFCFTEQILEPGESAQLGVSFFVDPEIVNDTNLDEVDTITLSYTFFEKPAEAGKTASLSKAVAAANPHSK